MTNHKKPKRLKQKFYTAKGKEPLKAVSSDLLIQQSETSKSIKNYNTAGIDYDKRIYNKLVRNMEAQKIASQSNDADLKIKLKNYGDTLRTDLKKSVIDRHFTTNAVAVSSAVPSHATGTVSPNVQTVSTVQAVNFTGQQRNAELENAYQKAYRQKKSTKKPTMKEVRRHLNSVSRGLISDNQINTWLKDSKRSISFEKAKRSMDKKGGMSTRRRTAEDREKERGRNERATAAEKRRKADEDLALSMDEYYGIF